jgi:hypothetical protein
MVSTGVLPPACTNCPGATAREAITPAMGARRWFRVIPGHIMRVFQLADLAVVLPKISSLSRAAPSAELAERSADWAATASLRACS